MRVAIEYQMAGLPIVGTPCRGGRDHYFDPETWTIVPPDARAIRDAVESCKARDLPRDFVRARAMDRIARDRWKFVSFVQGLIDAEGGASRFDATFEKLLRNDLFERWLSMREFAAETWAAVGGD